MAMTLEQLCGVTTEAQAVELLLTQLQALRFNARAWQSGSVQLTLLRAFARLYAGATTVVGSLAKAGFNDTAEGDWLDVLSLSHYWHRRKDAVRTEGLVTLSATVDAPGPFPFEPDDLVFVDSVRGQSFRNIYAGSIGAGEVLSVPVRAEVAGAAGDVAPGAITIMRTPLAGVTVDNPVPDDATSWITKNGSDVEANAAMRERNRNKWATLGIGSPSLAYAYWAATAHESVRRVAVNDQNPRGPGTIDVYLASDSGTASSVVADQVQAFFEGAGGDSLRKIGFGADLLVVGAEPLVLPIKATIYIQGSYNTNATRQRVYDAVDAYFRALPIGGARVKVDQPGAVELGALFLAMLSIAGVRNVSFKEPTKDRVIAAHQVVVPIEYFDFESV